MAKKAPNKKKKKHIPASKKCLQYNCHGLRKDFKRKIMKNEEEIVFCNKGKPHLICHNYYFVCPKCDNRYCPPHFKKGYIEDDDDNNEEEEDD